MGRVQLRCCLRVREGRGTEQELVGDAAERVEIGAVIDGRAARLLGRHVQGGVPITTPVRVRCPGRLSAVGELGDAEVEELHQRRGSPAQRDEEHVLRLEVAVGDAAGVRGLETARHLVEDAERL